MKVLLAVAVFFLISAQLWAEEIRADDKPNVWADWSNNDQVKEELPDNFDDLLERMARKPEYQQFFGLMGKRDAGRAHFSSKKRHRTDAFYGLMGKRALNSAAYERDVMQNYERRRK